MIFVSYFVVLLSTSSAAAGGVGAATESYKNQYCTDPRTTKKHSAFTEWADAYSCSRHRCQPGGRNLAIYTVGCKPVEAPESAIECEEVVEDTNMQFPYCCTRLRCLVVVRGEVWTKVLGQPWESLPAAPWSHMYKIKKPPPSDNNFLPLNAADGPVYTISESGGGGHNKALRPRAGPGGAPGHQHHGTGPAPAPRAQPPKSPDTVIVLNPGNEKDEDQRDDFDRNSLGFHKSLQPEAFFEDEGLEPKNDDQEEPLLPEKEINVQKSEFPSSVEKKDKPKSLQSLVDAIGNRMRDIEHVMKKMSEKVHHKKPAPAEPEFSGERQPGAGGSAAGPAGAADEAGYFSDASNAVFSRDPPAEPALNYIPPIEPRVKVLLRNRSGPKVDKKQKKQMRKKKSKGGKSHKKRRGRGGKKRKSFNSAELLRNVLSLEDNGSVINK